MLRPGSTFGRYTIVKLLGQGGMGEVYLVRHDVLDTEFALKVLSPEVAARTGSFIRRFIREAKLSSRIHHPNLVAVHDAGYESSVGLYYLVMDYVPGGTLRERLLALTHGLPIEQAVRIVGEIASALASASALKLVHRDIKPENIMFGEHGEARLADLGIAKAVGNDDSLMTMANAVFGTPAYMSPEQARDSGKVDVRADIYSLGIVFYEMLCGVRPYKDGASLNIIAQVLSPTPIPDVRSVRADVPETVAKVLADMCDKNVGRRIGSFDELLSRLSSLPGFVAVSAAASPPAGPCRQPRWDALVAVLVGAATVFGVYEWRHRDKGPEPPAEKVEVAVAGAAGQARTEPLAESVPEPLAEPLVANEPHQVESVPPSAMTTQEESTASPPPPPPEETAASTAVRQQMPTGRRKSPTTSTSRYPRVPVNVQPASVPSENQVQEKLASGSVVVLGDGSDARAALGRKPAETGVPLVALEAENPARLMRQIDDVIASNPKHVYLKLVGSAKARGISPDNFGATMFAVADRLRDKNVPFTCVVDSETDGNAPYNAAVREVCKLRSYECRQSEDK